MLALSAMLDMIGQLIVLPLLPFWTARFGGSAWLLGIIIASVPFAQLCTSPFWGTFSDRHGRRRTLLLGIASSVVGYVGYAIAASLGNLGLLVLSRLVVGLGGGVIGVMHAYIADVTVPERRIAALGWLSASTSAGVMVGPALGGLVGSGHLAAPGVLAALMALVNLVLAARFLPESRSESPGVDGNRAGTRQVIARIVHSPRDQASRLAWIYLIGMIAYNSMAAVMALHLARGWSADERSVGKFYFFIGALSLVIRALIVGRLASRLGETRLFRLGSLLLILGLVGIPLAPSYAALFAIAGLTPFGTAFVFPCVTARLSRLAAVTERGLHLGVQQSFGSVGRILAPVWACWSYDRLGASVPFWVAAALALVAASLWTDATPSRS